MASNPGIHKIVIGLNLEESSLRIGETKEEQKPEKTAYQNQSILLA